MITSSQDTIPIKRDLKCKISSICLCQEDGLFVFGKVQKCCLLKITFFNQCPHYLILRFGPCHSVGSIFVVVFRGLCDSRPPGLFGGLGLSVPTDRLPLSRLRSLWRVSLLPYKIGEGRRIRNLSVFTEGNRLRQLYPRTLYVGRPQSKRHYVWFWPSHSSPFVRVMTESMYKVNYIWCVLVNGLESQYCIQIGF